MFLSFGVSNKAEMMPRAQDGIVRELLLNVLKNEPDVIVREGSTDAEGVREASEGMRSARFCLHPGTYLDFAQGLLLSLLRSDEV